jgi:hypothetical protein
MRPVHGIIPLRRTVLFPHSETTRGRNAISPREEQLGEINDRLDLQTEQQHHRFSLVFDTDAQSPLVG